MQCPYYVRPAVARVLEYSSRLVEDLERLSTHITEIRDLLPGTEAPTVLRLDGSDDKVAVHAVCRENVFWETLENLKAAGASSLLVLPVEKMLA